MSVIDRQRVITVPGPARALGDLSITSAVVQGNGDGPAAPGFVVSTLAAAFPAR